MMRRIWAIAFNTYREAVRQKILYTLVFFSVVLILFSFFLGQLSLGADTKVIKDMGLFSIMTFGALIALFMGVQLVHREVERRTVYTILSKPVSRSEFVAGKYAGLCLTIALEVAAMTGLLLLVLSMYREPLDFNLLKAVLLIYAELCVLTAAALLFSSYSSSFMSMLFGVSFLVIGHVSSDFAAIFEPRAAKMAAEEGAVGLLGRGLSGMIWLLSHFDLDHFAINAKIVHGVAVSWGWIASALLYALSLIVILLLAAVWLFRRKDLA